MKILKVIGVFILIYFIRRFIEMYRMMKQMQETQLRTAQNEHNHNHAHYQTNAQNKQSTVVEADFKVVD